MSSDPMKNKLWKDNVSRSLDSLEQEHVYLLERNQHDRWNVAKIHITVFRNILPVCDGFAFSSKQIHSLTPERTAGYPDSSLANSLTPGRSW